MVVPGSQFLNDDALLTVKGRLDVSGRPRGAGRSIRSPAGTIGEARIARVPIGLREVRRLLGHTDQVMNLAISHDGRRLLSASRDRTVRVWDTTTGRSLHVLKGHQGPLRGLAISPDGRRALSGGDDPTIRLWDIESGKPLKAHDTQGDRIFAIAFMPDGRRALCAAAGARGSRSGRPATSA